MLKLIFTETSLHIEPIDTNLESWLVQRFQFASSVGEHNFITQEKIAFVLPDLFFHPILINIWLYFQGATSVKVRRCDVDRVEVELSGCWLSSQPDSIERVFVTQLPCQVEFFLWESWNRTKVRTVANDRVSRSKNRKLRTF